MYAVVYDREASTWDMSVRMRELKQKGFSICHFPTLREEIMVKKKLLYCKYLLVHTKNRPSLSCSTIVEFSLRIILLGCSLSVFFFERTSGVRHWSHPYQMFGIVFVFFIVFAPRDRDRSIAGGISIGLFFSPGTQNIRKMSFKW